MTHPAQYKPTLCLFWGDESQLFKRKLRFALWLCFLLLYQIGQGFISCHKICTLFKSHFNAMPIISYVKLQFLSGQYHSCMFQWKGNILKILSAQYCVWINQTICADTARVPVCLTVRAIWPLTRSMGVKGDFDPEASSIMEPASKAGKLAFPHAFSAHISLFPAALRESCMQTGAWNWDSKLWGIFFFGKHMQVKVI